MLLFVRAKLWLYHVLEKNLNEATNPFQLSRPLKNQWAYFSEIFFFLLWITLDSFTYDCYRRYLFYGFFFLATHSFSLSVTLILCLQTFLHMECQPGSRCSILSSSIWTSCVLPHRWTVSGTVQRLHRPHMSPPRLALWLTGTCSLLLQWARKSMQRRFASPSQIPKLKPRLAVHQVPECVPGLSKCIMAGVQWNLGQAGKSDQQHWATGSNSK